MSKNILILSYSDRRGDGVAAYDLAKCLIQGNYNVCLLVLEKTRVDSFIKQPTYQKDGKNSIIKRVVKKIAHFFLKRFKKIDPQILIDRKYDFFLNQELNEYFSVDTIMQSLPFIPDLIIAGSIHNLVNTSTLAALKRKTDAEVYMLTLDMAPLTGGCQHAWSCTGYQYDCNNCPAILSEQFKDVAHKNLALKLQNINEGGIKIIVASGRLLEQARRSTLFKNQEAIYNINSFINRSIFNSNNRAYAKQIFGLPIEKKVIFTGAEYTENERKGLKYFIEALDLLPNYISEKLRNDITILIASNNHENNDLLKKISFKKVFIDYMTDERLLSLAYQAADVFVCPSVEDPGPRMATQALACGTPVVGFEMGILYNMVINGYNGYKAELRNSEQLAEGLGSILNLNNQQFGQISANCVLQVEKHSSYTTVYEVFSKIF